MQQLFDQVSRKTSKYTTNLYSTSFSLGIKLFHSRFHDPIYGIYGFVRLADEIVDTFHGFNKALLLDRFRKDTYTAIEEGISLNPILHSFQLVVNKYGIDLDLIDKFLNSMEMDLQKVTYDDEKFNEYILGSAEVVGLMCLRVFCEGDDQKYELLCQPAMKLGAAFQKINFLRDLKNDYQALGRSYFPGIDLRQFNDKTKQQIEKDIATDFHDGLQGIKKLPKEARFGVYIAYVYYYHLFLKIKRISSSRILMERIRVSNMAKYRLLFTSFIRHQTGMF